MTTTTMPLRRQSSHVSFFQTELTFLNNRVTEMKRRMNSANEKAE